MRRSFPVALLLATTPLALAQELTPIRADVLKQVTQIVKTRAFVPGVDLGRWDAILEADRAKLASAATDEEFVRAVNVDLRKIGTSHFTLLTPRQNTQMRTLKTVGLGVTVRPAKAGLEIVTVVPTGPADKAKIKAGDILLRIDDKPATREALQGEEGKTVKVDLKGRKSQTLKFESYSVRRPITLTKVDENTALFRLPTFQTGYSRTEVEDLIGQATKYPNLIIDLRNNGGGAVVNMQHLMSLFIPAGSNVGTFVTKPLVNAYAEGMKKPGVADPVVIANWSRYTPAWSARQIRPSAREGGPLYKGNVVVLVNRGSASASEIFASAMHDTIGADIVGTKSAGAVLVALFQSVGNGFSLEFPTSDYVTVRNRRLEANPIVPSAEDPNPEAEVVKATYILRRAQLRKARFGG